MLRDRILRLPPKVRDVVFAAAGGLLAAGGEALQGAVSGTMAAAGSMMFSGILIGAWILGTR